MSELQDSYVLDLAPDRAGQWHPQNIRREPHAVNLAAACGRLKPLRATAANIEVEQRTGQLKQQFFSPTTDPHMLLCDIVPLMFLQGGIC
jgi:hypothetical protein